MAEEGWREEEWFDPTDYPAWWEPACQGSCRSCEEALELGLALERLGTNLAMVGWHARGHAGGWFEGVASAELARMSRS